MRIAVLTPTFSKFSGVDMAVKQQVSELTKKGNNVMIFALEADMVPPKSVSLEIMGVPKNFFLQRIYRVFFFLNFVKAIKWVPKLKNFGQIISHGYPVNWLGYLARKFYGVKHICWNHGILPPEVFSGFSERLYIRLIKILNNWALKRADSVVSVSDFIRKELKKETGIDSKVIYHKIDTRRFHPNINGSVIRRKYNLGNSPTILYVGIISFNKGVHLLIEAFRLVKQEIPSAKLVIVGKPIQNSYLESLKEMSDDSVIFAGYVSHEKLLLYYAMCDVYATCSLWESFDLPLAEAQSCGKPVVAFDVGAHKEIVNKQGFLVERGNVKRFSEYLIKSLESCYNSFSGINT